MDTLYTNLEFWKSEVSWMFLRKPNVFRIWTQKCASSPQLRVTSQGGIYTSDISKYRMRNFWYLFQAMQNEMYIVRLTSGHIAIFRLLLPYTLSFDHRTVVPESGKNPTHRSIAKTNEHRNSIAWLGRLMKCVFFDVRVMSICQCLKMIQVSAYALRVQVMGNYTCKSAFYRTLNSVYWGNERLDISKIRICLLVLPMLSTSHMFIFIDHWSQIIRLYLT